MISFTVVDPDQISEAYSWHRELGEQSKVIYPRPRDVFRNICVNGHLWAGFRGDTPFVAQAFYELDEASWEVGGVLVHPEERRKGLGQIIACLALAHLLVYEWADARSTAPVYARVLKANVAHMQGLLDRLKFQYVRDIKHPATTLPDLQAEEDGYVHGALYVMSVPETIGIVAKWCLDWDYRLGDGQPSRLILPLEDDGSSLRDWAIALQSLASTRNEQ